MKLAPNLNSYFTLRQSDIDINMLTPHQTKALDYTKHVSLTANAGSGKTFVLSKRYLEIALNEDLPLRNIAAITFTDKAAGELYQKIAKEIDQRVKSATDKIILNKLERIRRQLVSANISTIHSFCTDILREHPVEAGIDANFNPIDELFSDELIELSVEEVIKQALQGDVDSEELKYLLRLFSSKTILHRELARSLKHRRNLLLIDSRIYNKSAEEIAESFYHIFLTVSEKIISENLDDFLTAAEKVNTAVLNSSSQNATALEIKNILKQLIKAKKFETVISLLNELKNKMLVQKGTIAVKGYLNNSLREKLENECHSIEEFLASLKYFTIPSNHSKIELELAKFGKTFIHFFKKSLELYTNKKQEGGYLDYEDMLLLTQNILLNNDVRKSLSEKFKYIMIDEYQDTNELQYNIFLPILDDLKSGNLFVVGDEKQSIYMFRDAELEIFKQTKDAIKLEAGQDSILSLPDSFRMAPNLCVFINFLFKRLFANPNPLFNEVEHSDVVCARSDGINGNIEFLFAESSEDENEEIAEATLLSERILKLIKDGYEGVQVRWGDVAILCRKRKAFIELEKIFVKKNIPYSIIGGKGFYQRQSIYDIFNYFSFLLDQNDDTSLVGILRSPFFSVSDSEIFEISLQQGSNFWQKLNQYNIRNNKFSRIVELLSNNLSIVNSKDASEILRKIISETGYLSVLSQKANSVQEFANIRKLVNLTINFYSEGFRTLYDYVNFLKEAINEVEDESQAVISDEVNSVKIMTIHQAKGLEFPVVFLYRCGESTKKDSVRSKSVSVNKEFGLLTKVPLDENYFGEYSSAPIIGLSDYISDRKNLAEIKRLFYVGITRAKNQLFISASLESVESTKKDSFISLLLQGMDLDLDSESHKIESSLKLLTRRNEDCKVIEKFYEIKIPIIKKLESSTLPINLEAELSSFDFSLIRNAEDKPFGEIISATKLTIYNQCPLKYRLIYELGFSTIISDYHEWLTERQKTEKPGSFDFNAREEELLYSPEEEEKSQTEAKYSRVKGTIIHKILSEDTPENEITTKAELYLKKFIGVEEWDENLVSNLKTEIVSVLLNYYKSKTHLIIKSFSNYKNEFEVYHQQDDFYLFGIIDKLIIDNERLIIVDYKNDFIPSEMLHERANQYFTQLKFYSYIVSKLFAEKYEFELWVIFLRHPEQVQSMKVDASHLLLMKSEIEQMVKNSRESIKTKNLSHCQDCIFALNEKCIVH